MRVVIVVVTTNEPVSHHLFFSLALLLLTDSGQFTLYGADNPGIVHKITSALAAAGLSIDKLETDQEIAPHGGSVLFKMRGTAIATAPLAKHFDIEKIKRDLEELGDSLNCEVTMEDTVDDSYQGSFYAG
jgi:glycine cleavage system transcriptional repressor